MADESRKFVYRIVSEHVSDKGERIQEREVVIGAAPEDFMRFVGFGRVMANTNVGKFPKDFRFKIEAETIEEAYEKRDEAEKAALPRVQKELKEEIEAKLAQMRGPKIALPGGSMPPDMFRDGGTMRGGGVAP